MRCAVYARSVGQNPGYLWLVSPAASCAFRHRLARFAVHDVAFDRSHTARLTKKPSAVQRIRPLQRLCEGFRGVGGSLKIHAKPKNREEYPGEGLAAGLREALSPLSAGLLRFAGSASASRGKMRGLIRLSCAWSLPTYDYSCSSLQDAIMASSLRNLDVSVLRGRHG